jgi:hypothetical protein
MAERPRFSSRYLAYALGVVFFANFLNYADLCYSEKFFCN